MDLGPREYVEPVYPITPTRDAAIPGLTNPAPPVPKVEDPTERPNKDAEEKIPEGQFQTGGEAPDREYLKAEAIFLLPPQGRRQQYLGIQFSDAKDGRSKSALYYALRVAPYTSMP